MFWKMLQCADVQMQESPYFEIRKVLTGQPIYYKFVWRNVKDLVNKKKKKVVI